ncbi:MAG: FAD-dependent oxidoreductase [Firmicutes bacterium]|nr:FAD-dependent oxidoreductase [Bacillota bacterium]
MRTQNTLTGRVVAPWNPAYDVSRVDYNARFAPFFPDYIVYAEAIGDIVRALTWASHHHIEFRIRSGGHSYEAYSLLNRGLVIDVSALHFIHREESTGLWHMGPGATLLDVYQTLWNQAHMTIPGGSCPTVGLSGLTLGGGGWPDLSPMWAQHRRPGTSTNGRRSRSNPVRFPPSPSRTLLGAPWGWGQ